MRAAQTPLTDAERRTRLVRRAWTPTERAVVIQGFGGRAAIAIEPILGSIIFLGLTVGMIIRGFRVPDQAVGAFCIAGIFGIGLLGFIAYAIGVMAAPLRALLSTLQPIFIIDGYLRTRDPDEDSAPGSTGYVAVLTENQDLICEWPTGGKDLVGETFRPALVEFSEYGGIHRIDGHSTGVLPERIATLGVGMNAKR